MPGRAVRAGLLTAALVTLMSCSSNSEQPQEPSAPATPEGHGSLAECLADYGVPAAPGPVAGPPPGVDQDTWQQAMTACSTLAPGPAA